MSAVSAHASLWRAVALAACFGSAGGCNDDFTRPPREVPSDALRDGDAIAGEQVFALRCEACHARDGVDTGTVGPPLGEVTATLTDTELADIILNGTSTMPAIALDDSDLADVIAFLRATFPAGGVDTDPAGDPPGDTADSAG